MDLLGRATSLILVVAVSLGKATSLTLDVAVLLGRATSLTLDVRFWISSLTLAVVFGLAGPHP